MHGKFQERDIDLGQGVQHFTSLRELRRAERKAGLEPIEQHEIQRIGSVQEQAKKRMAEHHRATEGVRHRAIGEALRQHRRP